MAGRGADIDGHDRALPAVYGTWDFDVSEKERALAELFGQSHSVDEVFIPRVGANAIETGIAENQD